MNPKSFLFIGSWMQPLKALPLQQRWNVMEAIAEYSISGSVPTSLDAMETIAFGFIRNEIDRMKHRRNEVCEKRRAAANARWEKNQPTAMQTESVKVHENSDAKACNSLHADAPYDIESVSESESGSESEKKPSSTSSGVRVRENAGKQPPYDDSQLLIRFFGAANRAKVEALAMKHRVPIDMLKAMAEEITVQWALTDKTHDSYHDASLHLVFALADKVGRERKSRLQAIAEGGMPDGRANGMLGVGEYIDSEGRRTYNGVDFIPNDAPPRPGKAFYWNATTSSWDDIQ